jgi:hypothetical protein
MRFTINILSLSCFVISIVLAIFVKGVGPTNIILAILSVATFLFGIFGAHVMTNRHHRLDKLRETLRKDDAHYVTLYTLSKAFGKDVQKEVQQKVDAFIVKTIDLYLVDYYCANKEFLALFQYVNALRPKNKAQEVAYDKMLDILKETNENRRTV